jgi:hypothetical protein
MLNLDSRVQPINHLQAKALELLRSLRQTFQIRVERGRLQFFFRLLAFAGLSPELGVLAQQSFVTANVNPPVVPGVNHVIPSFSKLAEFDHQFVKLGFRSGIGVGPNIHESSKQDICGVEPLAVFQVVHKDARGFAIVPSEQLEQIVYSAFKVLERHNESAQLVICGRVRHVEV